MPQLGFIGIGTLGAPMVHCMAQNVHAPLIYDALSDAAHKAGKDSTLQVASRLAEVGEHAGNRYSDPPETWRAAEAVSYTHLTLPTTPYV